MAQPNGSYPRVNGGMIQSNKYTDMLVSVVGKVIGPTNLQTADGTTIEIIPDQLHEGLIINPDMCIEIIGQVQDATTVMAFVTRTLSTDMDLTLYDQMIHIQQSESFAHYFQHGPKDMISN